MTTYGKGTKTQENMTRKRAKRSAFSQQVTIRPKGTDRTACHTQNTNNNITSHYSKFDTKSAKINSIEWKSIQCYIELLMHWQNMLSNSANVKII